MRGLAFVGRSSGGLGVLADGGPGVGLRAEGGTVGASVRSVELGLAVDATEGISAFGDLYAILGNVRQSGTGVIGQSLAPNGDGTGVLGGAGGSGIGVQARALQESATALQVEGTAKFSTAGASTIPAGQDRVFVADSATTAVSHVTVTLTGDPGQATGQPGSKAVVVWIERRPGSGFVVHLSRPVRFATPFTYLIVEPVSI
jgi:hypothetical protein